MKKYRHVDALRGVAVLLVILVHTGQAVPARIGGFSWIAEYGQYGVQLFFVLSAFTLCTSLSAVEEVGMREYMSFLVRRVFRIAPLYYIAIFAYFALSVVCVRLFQRTPFRDPESYTVLDVAANILFVHGAVPEANNSVVPGGWSIGCEFLFYAVFPFLFVRAREKQAWVWWSALAAISVTPVWVWGREGYEGFASSQSELNTFQYYCIFNQFSSFAMGMLYYTNSKIEVFRKALPVIAIGSVAGLVFIHGSKYGWLLTPLLAGITSVGLALVLEEVHVAETLVSVGRNSFSMYIWHFVPVLVLGYVYRVKCPEALHTLGGAVALYGSIVGVTYFFAKITKRFIEDPFVKLGRVMADKIDRAQENGRSGAGP